MVDFNKEYAMSIPKDQWVKEHAHLGNTATLQAEWDKMNGKKAKAVVAEVAPVAEAVAEPEAAPIADPDTVAKEEPLKED